MAASTVASNTNKSDITSSISTILLKHCTKAQNMLYYDKSRWAKAVFNVFAILLNGILQTSSHHLLTQGIMNFCNSSNLWYWIACFNRFMVTNRLLYTLCTSHNPRVFNPGLLGGLISGSMKIILSHSRWLTNLFLAAWRHLVSTCCWRYNHLMLCWKHMNIHTNKKLC